MRNKHRTLLLDLDGTLADTAPDLAHALNTLRREEGFEPLPFETIRPSVSHGSVAIIEIGFDPDIPQSHAEHLRQRLLDHYENRLCVDTRLFDGMCELLDRCDQSGIAWGVVTNKPAYLTNPLMEQLELHERAACIVSGDTLEKRKPHPEPLLHACDLARGNPETTIYVGDAERDVEAGNRAGMTTLVALFGYLGDDDNPSAWGANGLIDHLTELSEWLEF